MSTHEHLSKSDQYRAAVIQHGLQMHGGVLVWWLLKSPKIPSEISSKLWSINWSKRRSTSHPQRNTKWKSNGNSTKLEKTRDTSTTQIERSVRLQLQPYYVAGEVRLASRPSRTRRRSRPAASKRTKQCIWWLCVLPISHRELGRPTQKIRLRKILLEIEFVIAELKNRHVAVLDDCGRKKK